MVIFSIHAERLCVLLVKQGEAPFQGLWGLPGEGVQPFEDLDQAADRILAKKAGISGVYLEQLYTFGGAQRDPRRHVATVVYYALVPHDYPLLPTARLDVEWHEVGALPELVFDHESIVVMARRRLAAKLDYSTIALQFMPEKFTLSALQAVYESVQGEALDKRNFRKRLQGLGCLEETGEVYRGGNHRPAKLFRVKRPGRVEIIK